MGFAEFKTDSEDLFCFKWLVDAYFMQMDKYIYSNKKFTQFANKDPHYRH